MLEQSSHIIYDFSDIKKKQTKLSVSSSPRKEHLSSKDSKKTFTTDKECISLSNQKYPLNSELKGSAQNTPAKSILSPNISNFLPKQESVENFQRSCFSTKDFMTKYMIRSVTAANFFQVKLKKKF